MNKIPCASQNTEAKTLPAAVHSPDCRFDSGRKWWIHVLSIVTYLCKISFLFCWNSCKQRSELLTRCCFWSPVSKRSTYYEHSFLIDKCSCKMVNTLPSDIFISSAISSNINLQSAKTSLWIFFFDVFWDYCRIWETLAFSIIVSVGARLKSAYLPLTIVSDKAESE